ncbi:hypothetical protein [Thiorhodospira sibirica]|uniref:hypothetical protein n=1 Tax=Thiorhodospira sibirica TaxID=154347 RepID=UPI00022C4C26|nr:hypothetical protein [Thiorhodospira sibirica]
MVLAAQIAEDPWIAWLQAQQVLAQVVYDDPASPQRPEIEDTSDRNWTPEMQRAWPPFIMGVSELWLGLIAEYQQDPELPKDALARYQALSDTLDQLWRHQGGHALIHHLSAIFAYREVDIIRRETFRF